jgi:hypothetical protein
VNVIKSSFIIIKDNNWILSHSLNCKLNKCRTFAIKWLKTKSHNNSFYLLSFFFKLWKTYLVSSFLIWRETQQLVSMKWVLERNFLFIISLIKSYFGKLLFQKDICLTEFPNFIHHWIEIFLWIFNINTNSIHIYNQHWNFVSFIFQIFELNYTVTNFLKVKKTITIIKFRKYLN